MVEDILAYFSTKPSVEESNAADVAKNIYQLVEMLEEKETVPTEGIINDTYELISR